MINVNIKDVPNSMLEYIQNTVTHDQPLRVQTNERTFVVVDESYYKKLCNNSLEQLTPEQLEELENEVLLEMAMERTKNYDPSTTISFDEMLSRLGLTEDDLEGWEDIEFE